MTNKIQDRWIAFVEEHTTWLWYKDKQIFVNDTYDYIKASPEDLFGWKIRFIEENEYKIEMHHFSYNDLYETMYYLWSNKNKTASVIDKYSSFEKAWDRFMELNKS